MQRLRKCFCILGLSITLGAVCPPGAAQSNKTVPLVLTDIELESVIERARQRVEEKDYAQAIQILQALIERSSTPFIKAGPDRFAALTELALDTLGSMPEEGLAQYRRLYGPKARRKLSDALASGDISALKQVASWYRHTDAGPEALEALGAMLFDRGQFHMAADTWARQLKVVEDDAKADVLIRMIAALHLNGKDADVQKLAAQLREKHGKTNVTLAGRSIPAVEALGQVLALDPIAMPSSLAGGREFHGWGAEAGQTIVMPPADVVLSPGWTYPAKLPDAAGELMAGMAAGAIKATLPNNQSNAQFKIERKDGYVLVTTRMMQSNPRGGRQMGNAAVAAPSAVLPTVVDQSVLVRSDDAVIALDLYTGQTLWQARLPMVSELSSTGWYYGGSYPAALVDQGRYGLTVGGDKVFTVFDFAPPVRTNRNQPGVRRSSGLAALSLNAEGKLLWWIGKDALNNDDSEALGRYTYLSAPAYYEVAPGQGRLYIVALNTEMYSLVCLDAETGKLLWDSDIAQTPPMSSGYANQPAFDAMREIGAPPVVVNGMAIVCTNSGVLGAFDADSGQGIWAYQYPSAMANANPMQIPGQLGSNTMQPNPIYVSGGRIFCLPADSRNLLAVNLLDGSPAWTDTPPRDGATQLLALPGERLLLTGRAARVLSMDSGATLFESGSVATPSGRPAVTEEGVLIPVDGGMVRLNIDDSGYRVSSLQPIDPSGVLGNLVAADGKLISANISGVCVYLSFQDAFDELEARLSKASPRRKVELYFHRARLATAAERYRKALADLEAATRIAHEGDDKDYAATVDEQIRPRKYQLYVALGNAATGPDANQTMREMFAKAQEIASTRQEHAHMWLRMAKYHERVGQFVEAISAAQQLAEVYSDEMIVDWPVGKAGNDLALLRRPQAQVYAQEWANGPSGFIYRLIRTQGREIYAAQDARAEKALADARAANDPEAIVSVETRWPHSRVAEDALYLGAEAFYLRAGTPTEDSSPKEDIAATLRRLNSLSSDPDSPYQVPATVALAAINRGNGDQTSADINLRRLEGKPDDTLVKFADIEGTLGQLIEQIASDGINTVSVPGLSVAAIPVPLRQLYSVGDMDSYILTDQCWRPARAGERVMVQKGDQTYLLEPYAADAASAFRQRALTGVTIPRGAWQVPGQRGIGAISGDSRNAVVCSTQGAAGFSTETLRKTWSLTPGDLKLNRFHMMATGGDLLIVADTQGKIVALHIDSGAIAWRADAPKTQNNRPGPLSCPPIVDSGVAVLMGNSYRSMDVRDLRTGKLLYSETFGDTRTQVRISPSGLMVTMSRGKFTVRDLKPGRIAKPLGQASYPSSLRSSLLAVNDRYALVARAVTTADDLLLWPLTAVGESKPIHLPLKQVVQASGAIQVMPIDATIAPDGVYLVCGTRFGQTSVQTESLLCRSRGLVMAKFSLRGKLEWTKDFDVETSTNNYYALRPLIMGQAHCVLVAQPQNVQNPQIAYVLDNRTGKVVHKLELFADQTPPNERINRARSMGQAVMTNGRLIVETDKGIAVYGGR